MIKASRDMGFLVFLFKVPWKFVNYAIIENIQASENLFGRVMVSFSRSRAYPRQPEELC